MLAQLDPMLLHVVEVAKRNRNVVRCILFGSRARGESLPESDYDIAVVWDTTGPQNWGAVADKIIEEKPVLNSVDLVRLDRVGDALRQRILREGKSFYEKS